MRHVLDARGTSVGLPDRVERVVSLVPSLTEWLVVAGVGERLVGVTDWCLEPAEALAGLARVRGTENPDLAAIRGLEPDLMVGRRRGEPQARRAAPGGRADGRVRHHADRRRRGRGRAAGRAGPGRRAAAAVGRSPACRPLGCSAT